MSTRYRVKHPKWLLGPEKDVVDEALVRIEKTNLGWSVRYGAWAYVNRQKCWTKREIYFDDLTESLKCYLACVKDYQATNFTEVKLWHKLTYHSWFSMKQRLRHNLRYSRFPLCPQWERSFPCFLTDMGPRPSKVYTIERVNNDRGYYPENCYWATWFEQARNRSSTVWLEYGGECLCLADWARKLSIHPVTLRQRLLRGWSIEKVLLTPAENGSKRHPKDKYYVPGQKTTYSPDYLPTAPKAGLLMRP